MTKLKPSGYPNWLTSQAKLNAWNVSYHVIASSLLILDPLAWAEFCTANDEPARPRNEANK